MMNSNDVKQEIMRLKKTNRRNTGIIWILSAVLIFVSVLALYVRFFSWNLNNDGLKY